MSRKHSKSKKRPKPAKSWYKQRHPKPVEPINNSFGCVIKSWRSPSRLCTATTLLPTLVEIHGTYSTSWDSEKLSFPYKTIKTIGYTTMVVTGDCSPAFAYNIYVEVPYGGRGGYFYDKGSSYKRTFVAGDCNMKEPYAPAQKMRLCNLIGFEGRFYAMSLQGSVVAIEEEKNKAGSNRFGITRVGGNRAVPSEASRHFREYMFGLDGEILVVLLVSRESLQVVDYVEVFRLDIERLLWVKVREIGNNRALILEDKRCSWAEACEMGVKRDCVYFTHKGVDGWMVFGMETSKISKISNACQEWVLLSDR